MVLNYNPHSSPRAGIAQIICPKQNVSIVVEEVRKKKMDRLPENYNPLELSPRSNHMLLRRKKALSLHRLEVMRYWERNAASPRDEAVAQVFLDLLKTAKQGSQETGEEEASTAQEEEENQGAESQQREQEEEQEVQAEAEKEDDQEEGESAGRGDPIQVEEREENQEKENRAMRNVRRH